MIETTVHMVLVLLFPPMLLGIINKTKAWFAGRRGAPVLQPYHDLIKGFRKQGIQSTASSWVFQAGPAVTLVATLVAGLLVPLGQASAPVSFAGDLILFTALLALTRFFSANAALAPGSAFGGMGSAREVSFAALSEPAVFFALLVLAKLSQSTSLSVMLQGNPGRFLTEAAPSLVLVAIGLLIVLLAESGRIPVDDPNTHLELTMIHEAMVLDHGGPALAVATYASSVKLFLLGSIVLNVALPLQTGFLWGNHLVFLALILGLAVLIGGLESMIARLRMSRVPYLLVTALLLCGSGFVLMLR